jgi:hypothetical protein
MFLLCSVLFFFFCLIVDVRRLEMNFDILEKKKKKNQIFRFLIYNNILTQQFKTKIKFKQE